MKLRRWFAVFALAGIGGGVIACAADEDLNPQPLPPSGTETDNPEKNANSSSGAAVDVPASSGGSSGASGGASSSASSSSGDIGATPEVPDGGADADASDQ